MSLSNNFPVKYRSLFPHKMFFVSFSFPSCLLLPLSFSSMHPVPCVLHSAYINHQYGVHFSPSWLSLRNFLPSPPLEAGNLDPGVSNFSRNKNKKMSNETFLTLNLRSKKTFPQVFNLFLKLEFQNSIGKRISFGISITFWY